MLVSMVSKASQARISTSASPAGKSTPTGHPNPSRKPTESRTAGLTNPLESEALLMQPKLDKLLGGLGETPEVGQLLEVLASHGGPDSMPCMNPPCTNECSWPTGGGRPPIFCSQNCRRAYARERASLLAQVSWLERYLSLDQVLGRAAPPITQRLSQARWQLARYPDLTQTSEGD